MGTEQVLDVMYQTFRMVLSMSLPLLLISMVVGVVIAIFQAATQINEQTMSFVPKLLAIVVLLGLMGSSMLAEMQDFMRQIFEMIVTGG